MDYQDRLIEQLVAYKARRLPGVEDGTWSHRGTPKFYPHILPKDQFRLNILPGIRDRFWTWFESANPRITKHQFFHHLNSSQALAFNLFFPFLELTTGRIDARLVKVLGLSSDELYTGQFEKVLDREENTNFDFYLEGPAGRKIFIELKLSESEFGSCAADEAHCRKLEAHYKPHLREHVDSNWLERDVFFKHYQILRNMSYLGRHPNSGLMFIYPKANESLMASDEVIKRIVSKALAPRVAIIYLESLIERILVSVEDDATLRDHFQQVKEKYLVLPARA